MISGIHGFFFDYIIDFFHIHTFSFIFFFLHVLWQPSYVA